MGAESQQEMNHPQSAGGRDECDIRSNTDLLLSKSLPINKHYEFVRVSRKSLQTNKSVHSWQRCTT